MLFVSLFYKLADWGTERLSNLPMVTQIQVELLRCEYRTSGLRVCALTQDTRTSVMLVGLEDQGNLLGGGGISS